MGIFSVIIPEGATNKVLNPSAETTANFAAQGAQSTVTQDTTYQAFGRYAYKIVSAGADANGVALTVSALANAIHYVTFMAYTTSVPAALYVSLNALSNTVTPTALWSSDGWTLYGASMPAAQCNGSTSLLIVADVGAATWYIDAIMCEQNTYWTTYVDGTQEGCYWTGTAHASTSTRSAQSRAGGKVVDIDATYGVTTGLMGGTGMPPIEIHKSDYAVLPGSRFQGDKIKERVFTLVFAAAGTSLSNLHSIRDSLIEAFKPDRVSPRQPVRLRYTGTTNIVEIAAYYAGGLEAEIGGPPFERMAVRFIAMDPFWHSIKESAFSLTTKLEVANADYAVKKIDGTWSNVTTNFNANVHCATIDNAGQVYFGGSFTDVGDANGDYIVKYNPVTGAFTSLGTGMNALVKAIVVAPNGDVYAGGEFTLAGGVADTVYIARWDGSTWNPLSTGLGGVVYDMVFGQDGLLYVGGTFTNAGDANGDRIVTWSGSAWASLGSGGLDGGVWALAVGPDGSVYAGGSFTQMGGVSNTAYIAKWSGTAWTALGTGMDTYVRALEVAPDGSLYAGGDFTTAGGVSALEIAKWNGSVWVALGTGLSASNSVYTLKYEMATGLLYVGGSFTTAGGLTTADRIATWNGTTWSSLDIDLPGSPFVYDVAVQNLVEDQFEGQNIVEAQYGGQLLTHSQLYITYSTEGSAFTSTGTGSNAVANSGSANTSQARLVFKRSGGTLVTVEWIKNETTGKTMRCNYSLLDGETLTLDFRPGVKTITSSHFGNVLGRTALPGSDFATFALQPGSNTISVKVKETGSPTITAYLLWRSQYWSQDGAA